MSLHSLRQTLKEINYGKVCPQCHGVEVIPFGKGRLRCEECGAEFAESEAKSESKKEKEGSKNEGDDSTEDVIQKILGLVRPPEAARKSVESKLRKLSPDELTKELNKWQAKYPAK